VADITIGFNRGARRVTGSNFLVTVTHEGRTTRLLIDCGLAQGGDVCDPINETPFTYDTTQIDALFFTHAHTDHIGLFPKLVKDGFQGKVYTTIPTAELMPIMLEDTAGLLRQEALKCNTDPLYTKEDVMPAVRMVTAKGYHEPIAVGEDVTVTLINAGHILGSACVVIESHGKKVLFTGDLGRSPAILVPTRETVQDVDALVTESVYGNRVHGSVEASEETLKAAILETVQKRGVLIIPAFSLERTQIILAAIDRMMGEGTIPQVPVFMDSPLASKVTHVYTQNPEFLSPALKARLERCDDPFSFKTLTVTVNTEESSAIDGVPSPKVIIAGAGMSHGGRVRHHEKAYLPLETTTLLLVGYQVPGSLGRRLRDGQKVIEIDGKQVRVRAKVAVIDGFSAHADRDDLLAFADEVHPKRVFVVLGETEASVFLAQRISGFLGIPVDVPKEGEEYKV
jgi:metallo-beta-lactamase family protein